MNGLEALQALKEGKIVRYCRNKDGYRIFRDSLYCYRAKYEHDKLETDKKIWTKFADSWVWQECDNPTTFWMVTQGFEIVEESEIGGL